MKKKLLVGAFLMIALYVIFFVDNSLQLAINFIVDGLVPGTDIRFGFMPTIALIIGLLFLVIKWIQEIRFEMIRQTALEINAERVAAELNTSYRQESSERRKVVASLNVLEQARS